MLVGKDDDLGAHYGSVGRAHALRAEGPRFNLWHLQPTDPGDTCQCPDSVEGSFAYVLWELLLAPLLSLYFNRIVSMCILVIDI